MIFLQIFICLAALYVFLMHPRIRRADSSPPEGSQKPLGPRRDTPAGAQCVLGGNPLNTR